MHSYAKFVAESDHQAPPQSGFKQLKGKIYYLPRLRMVKVIINGVKDPANKGPPIGVNEAIDWVAGGGDFAGMREHLQAKLKQTYRLLRDRDSTLKERDVYLTKCNVTGRNEADFMEAVCSGCVCWYCELAGG
jgi:hypothetical protein